MTQAHRLHIRIEVGALLAGEPAVGAGADSRIIPLQPQGIPPSHGQTLHPTAPTAADIGLIRKEV